MRADKKLLTAISRLYDASINSQYWGECLDLLAPLVGAKSSALLVLETLGKYDYSISETSSAFSSDAQRMYVEKYSKYEEKHFSNVATSEPGEIVFDADYLKNERRFRQRPDVAFLLEIAGVYERFAVRLNAEKAWFDCLTFQYEDGRGNISDSEKLMLRQIIPHVAKATDLSQIYSELRSRYSAVLSVLDRLRLGVFIVLPTAEVVLKNTTADEILAHQNGLCVSNSNKLAAANGARSSMIDQAIEEASCVVEGSCQGKSTKLVVPKRSEQGEYILDIAPLRDTDNELEKDLAGALVTVVDTEMYDAVNMGGLTELYHLSAAEAEVANLLVHGKKYHEIAESRGVTPETIKTQVNSIYSKTGSSSRSELFARILKINVPIV